MCVMVSVLDLGSGVWVHESHYIYYFFFHFNKFQKITGMFVNILLNKID